MTRLRSLPVNNLTPKQRSLFDGLTGGKRSVGRPMDDFLAPDGGMRGPFNAMLHHPVAGNAVQRLGEILRFEGNLSDILREVAILTVGRHWKAQYEWWAHANIARKAGMDEAVIQAIYDRTPLPTQDGDIQAVHGFVKELVETQHVGDENYAAAHDALGDTGVVELVILAGYYGLISATLNTFQVPLPDGETPPFDKSTT